MRTVRAMSLALRLRCGRRAGLRADRAVSGIRRGLFPAARLRQARRRRRAGGEPDAARRVAGRLGITGLRHRRVQGHAVLRRVEPRHSTSTSRSAPVSATSRTRSTASTWISSTAPRDNAEIEQELRLTMIPIYGRRAVPAVRRCRPVSSRMSAAASRSVTFRYSETGEFVDTTHLRHLQRQVHREGDGVRSGHARRRSRFRWAGTSTRCTVEGRYQWANGKTGGARGAVSSATRSISAAARSTSAS